MVDTLLPIIIERCGLKADQKVLVGVSGGPDSLCLMDVLLKAGLPLIIAHFNHHLRHDSAMDALAVEKHASTHQVPFVLGEGDVSGYAIQNKMPVEEAARILRYQFLFAQAEHFQAQAVAVAHHADDQVETVFMHILRGTALEGLAGMPVRLLPNPWSASIPLVRPLLSVWRNDIEAYCLENGLEPVQDNSNQDVSYTRNRIRKQLLPVLERYNPRFKHALWRMSQILEADLDLLQQATHAAWKDCLAQTGDGFVTLHQDRFCSLPLAIQRRLLRQTFASLERVDLDYEMVERGIQSVNQPRLKSRIDLGRGLSLFQEDALIWLAAWEAELPAGDWPQVELAQGETLSLNVPGNISLSPGWNLSSEWLPGDFALPMAQCNTDPFQAFIDANLVNLNLVVRPRIPGDQFHPLGLEAHTQKLSDFMINVKLPRRSRQKWPLVCMGDRVIWIPGYALSHFARLEAGTAKAIHLRVKKAN